MSMESAGPIDLNSLKDLTEKLAGKRLIGTIAFGGKIQLNPGERQAGAVQSEMAQLLGKTPTRLDNREIKLPDIEAARARAASDIAEPKSDD